MAMFHLLKIRTNIDIFKNEKCKCIFGLEYIRQQLRYHISELALNQIARVVTP